ncbi:MAG: hypothetical protein QM677_01690 [Microbacterium sp.]
MISKGRVARVGSIGEISAKRGSRVIAVNPDQLGAALEQRCIPFTSVWEGDQFVFTVSAEPRLLSEVALQAGALLDELQTQRQSLEDVYFDATEGAYQIQRQRA